MQAGTRPGWLGSNSDGAGPGEAPPTPAAKCRTGAAGCELGAGLRAPGQTSPGLRSAGGTPWGAARGAHLLAVVQAALAAVGQVESVRPVPRGLLLPGQSLQHAVQLPLAGLLEAAWTRG